MCSCTESSCQGQITSPKAGSTQILPRWLWSGKFQWVICLNLGFVVKITLQANGLTLLPPCYIISWSWGDNLHPTLAVSLRESENVKISMRLSDLMDIWINLRSKIGHRHVVDDLTTVHSVTCKAPCSVIISSVRKYNVKVFFHIVLNTSIIQQQSELRGFRTVWG